MRVLVTGSNGFIGRRVMALLKAEGHEAIGADLDHSVLSPHFHADADVAIHLAAHKYAGMGEERPEEVAHLNIVGTGNVVRAVPRVILASTCKAAAPITCYGASKLIAERIVLNAGGTVVRLVNVLGSSGSVTEIWDALPDSEPLPVTDTQRMYITPERAAELFVDALYVEPGRYAPKGPELIHTSELAERQHPGRPTRDVPLRRGDRPVERLTNDHETAVPAGNGLMRIVDAWERQPVALAAWVSLGVRGSRLDPWNRQRDRSGNRRRWRPLSGISGHPPPLAILLRASRKTIRSSASAGLKRKERAPSRPLEVSAMPNVPGVFAVVARTQSPSTSGVRQEAGFSDFYIGRGTVIGKHVTFGPGTVIGSPGFGYEKVDGRWVHKPETHGVVIGDDVDIGANTCIDRGSYRDTVIGRGTKIDNLVHIAHNVQVGEDCLVIAGAEISGSVVIGDGAWIGPNACIREHLTIGAGALVGIGAVVVKDVEPGQTVIGNPARPMEVK